MILFLLGKYSLKYDGSSKKCLFQILNRYFPYCLTYFDVGDEFLVHKEINWYVKALHKNANIMLKRAVLYGLFLFTT